MWNMLIVKETALVSFWHFWLPVASLRRISSLSVLYYLRLSKATLCKAVVEHCCLLRSCILCFEHCMTKVHMILIASHKREPLNQLPHHLALFNIFIFMFYVGNPLIIQLSHHQLSWTLYASPPPSPLPLNLNVHFFKGGEPKWVVLSMSWCYALACCRWYHLFPRMKVTNPLDGYLLHCCDVS